MSHRQNLFFAKGGGWILPGGHAVLPNIQTSSNALHVCRHGPTSITFAHFPSSSSGKSMPNGLLHWYE